MDLGLRDLRALVGGGSRGLGRAIATELTAEGARTAIAARPGDQLAAAARELGAVAAAADLSSADGAAAAVDAALAAFAGLDLLVVNSGGPAGGTFDRLDDAAWTT